MVLKCYYQVVEQGLAPAMALRACSLPDSSATALIRSLTTAVNDVAPAEVELEDHIRSVEAPSEGDDVPPSGE